ncbi:hypothetical protein [Breoghania sp. L-A4]|uniref:hypothetical protein n=1 Tax=Breoghania sp. L-A4 TaxID=2304600 RepID=UPI000E359A7C|nr:hypothetical protein [Breoghania sp. L-A4]AXS40504.1 hypothetical protein D1F64_11085 [Breoghania sp. L-A4]
MAVLIVALAMPMAGTGAVWAADEVHIITRDDGSFVSSHRLYAYKHPHTTAVDYCGRSYFVHRSTIEWTEMAAIRGYSVALEYSDGTSWQLICRNPQDQVASDEFTRQDFVNDRKYRKSSNGGSWFDTVIERRKKKFVAPGAWSRRGVGNN